MWQVFLCLVLVYLVLTDWWDHPGSNNQVQMGSSDLRFLGKSCLKMLAIVAALINLPYKQFTWLYTDRAQKRQNNISLGRKAWKQVIAPLKWALICWVKTILYVTREHLAIQFLLVKSLFFDLTSRSRTWEYRSGISPAGPEKWLGPGIYVLSRKTCFSLRKKRKSETISSVSSHE